MPHDPTTSDDDGAQRRKRALAGCTRFVHGHPRVSSADRLRALADAAESASPDVYGQGGDVALLEREVAELLGKPAAVLMPTGTMAQQCALRVWTDRTARPAVAVHGLSHLVVHEKRALEVLHGVRLEPLTAERRPLRAQDLVEAPGPFGALCVELPLRDAGYLLPTWDELVELVGAARERSLPIHLDGARLWESQPYYDRSHAEIAALADSVYVSFYKGLGGLSAAALAGPQDVVDAARQWQHRHGGTMYSLLPYAVSARAGLAHVDAAGAWVDRARALATALAAVPGLRVFPDPPQASSFVLYADVPAEALREQALRLAETERVWALGSIAPADVPRWSTTEVVVGPATLGWTADEVVELVTTLVRRALEQP